MTYHVDVYRSGTLWCTIEALATNALEACNSVELALIKAKEVVNHPLLLTGKNGQPMWVNWTGLDFQARRG